jgi:hypothetical protein
MLAIPHRSAPQLAFDHMLTAKRKRWPKPGDRPRPQALGVDYLAINLGSSAISAMPASLTCSTGQGYGCTVTQLDLHAPLGKLEIGLDRVFRV